MIDKTIVRLTLWFSFIVSLSAWAGDVKPLHACVQPGLYQRSLGTAATAKDKYRVICPSGTKSFQAQVKDEMPIATPVVSINITASSKAGSTDGVRSDTVDGNGFYGQCSLTGYSSYTTRTLTTASAVPVTFDFEVYKSATGTENYSISEHCRSAIGVDLGNAMNLEFIQNQ